jgi:hypothetical protein
MTVLITTLLAIAALWLRYKRPTNERDWSPDQALLPYAEFAGEMVTVHNIRNFTYASPTEFVPNYYNKTFDLSTITRMYFGVVPLDVMKGVAHVFVSFEFDGHEYMALSVEVRKKRDSEYSPIGGFLRQFEVMYVIGDERDIIKLRTNYRNNRVYLYPLNIRTENVRKIFVSMLEEANKLKKKPAFYNTLTGNCVTHIIKHVNKVSPKKIPFDTKVLLPENADMLLYDLELIDTHLPFDKAREVHMISERARRYSDDPDFSAKIRAFA